MAAQRIANGEIAKLAFGDIPVKKFTYAGDTAEAIWKFINNNTVFEIVIGSGKAYAIADWFQLWFSYYNLNWEIMYRKSPVLLLIIKHWFPTLLPFTRVAVIS